MFKSSRGVPRRPVFSMFVMFGMFVMTSMLVASLRRRRQNLGSAKIEALETSPKTDKKLREKLYTKEDRTRKAV
jgi:hypothetical protein